MPLPIESVLGIDQLTGLVANPMGGAVANLPPAFFSTLRQVEAMTTFYERVTHVRNAARLTDPAAPAHPTETPNAGKIPVTLAHSREFMLHDPGTLQRLVAPTSEAIQGGAIREIGRKTTEFNRRFDNLRKAAVCSAVSNGKIYFNAKGQLLPSSSGAVITVDFNVPTNNLNNTGLGAWNTASTNILKQIEEEQRRLTQLTGLNYTNVLYGSAIPGYLSQNDYFSDFIQTAPVLAQAFASNTVPASFGSPGLTWWNGTNLWYEDADGTMRNWVAAGTVILFPDVTSDWYELLEGPYIIPEDLGSVYGSSEQAVNGFVGVSGRFSYAVKSTNPPGIQHFIGDTFLPVVKVPGALRICTDVTQAAT